MEQGGYFIIYIYLLTQGLLFTKIETEQIKAPLYISLCVLSIAMASVCPRITNLYKLWEIIYGTQKDSS